MKSILGLFVHALFLEQSAVSRLVFWKIKSRYQPYDYILSEC